MIYELNHVGLLVSDLEASLRFYRDALGGSIVFQGVRPEGPTDIVYLHIGSGLVELISGGVPDPEWGHYGLHHIGFMTDDIETDYARLVAGGASPWRAPAPAGTGVGKTAFVLDPNGVRVELLQRDVDFREGRSHSGLALALDHYSILARDHGAASAFYGALLGMEVLSEKTDPDSGHTVSYFALGADSLEVHSSTAPRESEAIDHIALRVGSVSDSLETLKSAGLTAEVGSPRRAYSGIGSIAEIREPDGATVELLDRPALRRIL